VFAKADVLRTYPAAQAMYIDAGVPDRRGKACLALFKRATHASPLPELMARANVAPAAAGRGKLRAVAPRLQKISRRIGIVDRLAGLVGTASRLP
jgi:hypothetical protein